MQKLKAGKGVDGPQLLRVTPSELKKHKTRDDAWTAINGNVYNMTPFMDYHPGGDDELMRVAGRDGTRLFGKNHGLYIPETEGLNKL